ncbi:alpha/beta hydrolase, partial [Cryobacterium fucosi]
RVGLPAPARPPTGFGDLAARLPSAATGGAQVRVERYGPAGSAAWVVYIGGTAEWSPVVTAEPWDLSSNVAAVAEEGAGSYRAVLEAMREAGVQPSDPVVQVGHSQGGLVASQVAASGEFNTVMIATFGAPNGQVEVPAGLAAVAVEHSDDIVPALGGPGGRAEERLVVRREVFATEPVPVDQALPAHALTAYRETAGLMDGSPEPRLQSWRSALATVLGEKPGSMSRWRGVRASGD